MDTVIIFAIFIGALFGIYVLVVRAIVRVPSQVPKSAHAWYVIDMRKLWDWCIQHIWNRCVSFLRKSARVLAYGAERVGRPIVQKLRSFGSEEV